MSPCGRPHYTSRRARKASDVFPAQVRVEDPLDEGGVPPRIVRPRVKMEGFTGKFAPANSRFLRRCLEVAHMRQRRNVSLA